MIRRGKLGIRSLLIAAMVLAGAIVLFGSPTARAQGKLSPKWEELTAADFRAGLQQSRGRACCPLASWKNMARTCRSERTC